MPRVRCNLLMPKPFAPALLAGMACALSVHRGRGVPHATSETHRWCETRTGGRRHTVIAVLQGSEVVHLTHARSCFRRVRLCRSDASRYMPLPVCSCS
jgi:hypothetical protein